MFSKLLNRGLNAELVATFLFIVVSFVYIVTKFGFEQLTDALFLSMFPASIMIFLILLIVKVIERFHDRKVKSYKYLDWRNR